MKKIFISIIAVLMLLIGSLFTGCGMVRDAADTAETVITDAADGISEAASDIADNNNGDVKDNDGIIGNNR